MTIKDFVMTQPKQGINEWLKVIEANKFQEHENTILDCAESLDKIEVNHSAEFKDAIKVI